MRAITNYWLKYYVENDLCVLCGNHGVISTDGVKSPAGVSPSKKKFQYCICPNGQSLRKQNATLPNTSTCDQALAEAREALQTFENLKIEHTKRSKEYNFKDCGCEYCIEFEDSHASQWLQKYGK